MKVLESNAGDDANDTVGRVNLAGGQCIERSRQSNRRRRFAEDSLLASHAALDFPYSVVGNEVAGSTGLSASGNDLVAIQDTGDLQSADFRRAGNGTSFYGAGSKGACDRVVPFRLNAMDARAAKTRRHARNEIPDPRARLLYAAVV